MEMTFRNAVMLLINLVVFAAIGYRLSQFIVRFINALRFGVFKQYLKNMQGVYERYGAMHREPPSIETRIIASHLLHQMQRLMTDEFAKRVEDRARKHFVLFFELPVWVPIYITDGMLDKAVKVLMQMMRSTYDTSGNNFTMNRFEVKSNRNRLAVCGVVTENDTGESTVEDRSVECFEAVVTFFVSTPLTPKEYHPQLT